MPYSGLKSRPILESIFIMHEPVELAFEKTLASLSKYLLLAFHDLPKKKKKKKKKKSQEQQH